VFERTWRFESSPGHQIPAQPGFRGPARGIEVRMTNFLHKGDLPAGVSFGPVVAIDTETMGLVPQRDRLCLVQLSGGDGNAHLVQISRDQEKPTNLTRLLTDPAVLKVFHFGRFDIAVLLHRFDVLTTPVYCTKIAAKLVRTFTDKHGLKYLLQDVLDIDISKQQQSSDWGAATLTNAQLDYAASDVLYLHHLKSVLDKALAREHRTELAQACFDFLPFRAALDLAGWPDTDIFAH
jgi:ribonuclease D